jgi:predicted transcriptional regulator
MSKLQVQGYSNLVKDSASGGVVNNDPQTFIEYQKKRKAALEKLNANKALENRVSDMESDINNIKSDVKDMKNMLNQLLLKLT